MSLVEKVDIKREVEENYDCFYDFLDMMSFEISKYFKPYLPFRSSEGHQLDDPAVLTRDVYNVTERYFKNRCSMDPKKVNYEQFAAHFVNSYKEHLPKDESKNSDMHILEEDVLDVMTDTARREIYN